MFSQVDVKKRTEQKQLVPTHPNRQLKLSRKKKHHQQQQQHKLL